jgi:hypothetical protein
MCGGSDVPHAAAAHFPAVVVVVARRGRGP